MTDLTPQLPPITSPVAEAIEEMLEAARAWIDGPGEQSRRAAAAFERPDVDAAVMSRGGAWLGISAVKATIATVASGMDALAGLADPPQTYRDHRVTLSIPPQLTWNRLSCSPPTSWSPFGQNEVSNPPLSAELILDGPNASTAYRTGPIDVTIRVRPVPATPELTVSVTVFDGTTELAVVVVDLPGDAPP